LGPYTKNCFKAVWKDVGCLEEGEESPSNYLSFERREMLNGLSYGLVFLKIVKFVKSLFFDAVLHFGLCITAIITLD